MSSLRGLSGHRSHRPSDRRRDERSAVHGRTLLIALSMVAIAVGAPTPSGARARVDVVQLELVDDGRPTSGTVGVPAAPTRTLPTTVYLPPITEAAPLIVLAHGAGGAPEKFTELASYWSARGYVVAVPRFPLTNDQVRRPVLAEFEEQGRDVRFVIDELVARGEATTGELAGRVDPVRIGLFGLSLGSLTVWSAVFDGAGELAIDAMIQSDGTTLITDERVGSIDFPVLVAHSDVDPIFAYPDVVARYEQLPGSKYLLTLHGAAHATVGENTVTPADATYRETTTVFWDRTLGARPDSPFPPLIPGVTSFSDGTDPAPAGSVATLPATL